MKSSSGMRYKLFDEVIKNSMSKDWCEAVQEWDNIKTEEDESIESTCVCGKENIKYLHTIKNIKNGNVLYPIGSSCIKKFGRKDLDEVTNTNESLFKLLHAVRDNKFISLTSDLFSRKLLKYLYENGAFKATEYNGLNGESDYKFMLNMFNKRSDPTTKQQRKINAIIVNSIKPFLEDQLSSKIVSKKVDNS